MSDEGCELRLAIESDAEGLVAGQILVQHLESDSSLILDVTGLVDRAETTGAYFPDDFVSLSRRHTRFQ
jgi:hypothetical protein